MNSLIFVRRANIIFTGLLKTNTSTGRYFTTFTNKSICLTSSSTTFRNAVTKHNLGFGGYLANKICLREFNMYSFIGNKDKSNASHGISWFLHRFMTVFLVGGIPIWFNNPNTFNELTIIFLISLHVFWGLENILVDYVRPAVFGKVIPKYVNVIAAIPVLIVMFALTDATLRNQQLQKTIIQFWNLKTKQELDAIEQKRKLMKK